MTAGTINLENYKKLKSAANIEAILCLATLVATETLPTNATLEDAHRFYEKDSHGLCWDCPVNKKCLACIINE